MLSLGKADCILVSRWTRGAVRRVLIDGGERQHAPYIKAFLRRRGALNIDHVVCSHLHKDHAEGLIELAKDRELHFGRAWVHKTEENVDVDELNEAFAATADSPVSQFLFESIVTQQTLVRCLEGRGVTVSEPFTGKRIGFLGVCGPSRGYYTRLLARFRDVDRLRVICEQVEAGRAAELVLEAPDELTVAPRTAPENNASTILVACFGGGNYLFTGDAGAEALERVAGPGVLEGCTWMQIPHHGSRHNITRRLIDHFRPEVAFVSADGETHPYACVVDAFREAGTTVFGTHWPEPGDLWYRVGRVRPRLTYGDAVPV
jgi:beta-lactamase superfamily II metal-dependent hydrolase